MPSPFNILILGGTRNARDLAILLSKSKSLSVVTSLAGRTQEPDRSFGITRIGGFGGTAGLVKYLQLNLIDMLVDSTHPFATNISQNARAACEQANVARLVLDRPKWQKQSGDIWTDCANLEETAEKIPTNSTAFLALGHQYLHRFTNRDDVKFIVRLVDPPISEIPLKHHELVIAKPSHIAAEEEQLFRQHRITHLVSRNSGGTLIYAKIEAARKLQLPVLMIARPPAIPGESFQTVEEIAEQIIRLSS